MMFYAILVNQILLLKLLYSYRRSLYGCELWSLDTPELQSICVSWRRALKRVWHLPRKTHSNILYALCGKWSIDDEICRRQLKFFSTCLSSTAVIVILLKELYNLGFIVVLDLLRYVLVRCFVLLSIILMCHNIITRLILIMCVSIFI